MRPSLIKAAVFVFAVLSAVLSAAQEQSTPPVTAAPAPAASAVEQQKVFVFVQRTEGHIKLSSLAIFRSVLNDLVDYLKAKNVAIAVDVNHAESATPLDTIFTYARAARASSVLYVVVDRPLSKFLKITVQCFDMNRKQLWQAEASHSNWWPADPWLEQSTKKLHAQLDMRVGKDGLPILASAIVPQQLMAATSSTPTPPSTDSSSTGSEAGRILLHNGTAVVIANVDGISSKSISVGQHVAFKVLQDVRVGDKVVIVKGADASGVVNEVRSPRRMGRGAQMTIDLETIITVTGEAVRLRTSQDVNGGSQRMQDAASVLWNGTQGYGAIFLPLVLLMHGDESILPKATKDTAYIGENVQLDAVAVAESQPAAGPARPAPPGYATVRVFLGKQDFNGGSTSLYCGKVQIANPVFPGHYVEFHLSPGKYAFHHYVKQGKCGFVVDLADGEEYYVRGVMSRVLLDDQRVRFEPALESEFELLANDLQRQTHHVKDISQADPAKLRNIPKCAVAR